MLGAHSFTFARLFVSGWSRNIVVKEQVPHRFAVSPGDKVRVFMLLSCCTPGVLEQSICSLA
jgi:hypothetical protein